MWAWHRPGHPRTRASAIAGRNSRAPPPRRCTPFHCAPASCRCTQVSTECSAGPPPSTLIAASRIVQASNYRPLRWSWQPQQRTPHSHPNSSFISGIWRQGCMASPERLPANHHHQCVHTRARTRCAPWSSRRCPHRCHANPRAIHHHITAHTTKYQQNIEPSQHAAAGNTTNRLRFCRQAERERLEALSSCDEPTTPSPSAELFPGVDERDGSAPSMARLRFRPDATTPEPPPARSRRGCSGCCGALLGAPFDIAESVWATSLPAGALMCVLMSLSLPASAAAAGVSGKA